jgi:hypothetical protein
MNWYNTGVFLKLLEGSSIFINNSWIILNMMASRAEKINKKVRKLFGDFGIDEQDVQRMIDRCMVQDVSKKAHERMILLKNELTGASDLIIFELVHHFALSGGLGNFKHTIGRIKKAYESINESEPAISMDVAILLCMENPGKDLVKLWKKRGIGALHKSQIELLKRVIKRAGSG